MGSRFIEDLALYWVHKITCLRGIQRNNCDHTIIGRRPTMIIDNDNDNSDRTERPRFSTIEHGSTCVQSTFLIGRSYLIGPIGSALDRRKNGSAWWVVANSILLKTHCWDSEWPLRFRSVGKSASGRYGTFLRSLG